MVRMATSNDDDALDVVQEAMTRLIGHYRDRPEQEWKPLFYRILENCLADLLRHQNRWKKLVFWRSDNSPELHDESIGWESDSVINSLVSDDDWQPDQRIARERQQQAALAVIRQLPTQQQQCFLLRCWEGLSVRETAAVLEISEGSVKTHMSRVRQKLNEVVANYEN